MAWVSLMLVAAFCQAVKDLCLKRSVAGVDGLAVVWSYCTATTLFLAPVALWQGIPQVTWAFWASLFTTGPLAVVTFHYYVKSLKLSDLSLTAPMLAATPLFLLLTSPVILGEFPAPIGLVGIVILVAGSYVMNLRHLKNGMFAPFKALLHDPGPRLMLLVAFLWSISANIDKIGLRNSSPVFWITCAFGFTALLLTPIVWRRTAGGFAQVLNAPWYLLATGLLEAVTCLCQMDALTMTIVPYIVAVKRMSAVFAVLLGWLVLREGSVRERLAGATLMVLGVFLIAFLG